MEIGCKFRLPNILIIQLEQIFTAIFTRVRYSRRASIKGLPNPCACFTFIYRINKKSLAVYHELRRLTPHPWHPFNGVVTNRTSRTICQRIHHTSREYYPHDIASQIIFSAFILALDTRNTTYGLIILLYCLGYPRFFQHHAPYHVCNSVHLLGTNIVRLV